MKHRLFSELRQSMAESLEHAQGKRELRTTLLPAAPSPRRPVDVRGLRDSLNASQAVFARYLNVSPQLVRAWESGRRRPIGAALKLLEVAARHPEIVFAGLEKIEVLRDIKTSEAQISAGDGVAHEDASRQVRRRLRM